MGPNVPIGDETSSPSSAVENLDPDGEGEVTNDVTLGDPVFTLGISMGGEDERTLSYYAGQVRGFAILMIFANNARKHTVE